MNSANSSLLPWRELLAASQQRETPWADVSTRILSRLMALDLNTADLGTGEELPLKTLEKISLLFDDTVEEIEKMDYFIKISMSFGLYQTLIGVFLQAIHKMEHEREARQALMQLAHAVLVRSLKQHPFSLSIWQKLNGQLTAEDRMLFDDLLSRAEHTIMLLTGNTVYSFFEESCTREEIDELLGKAYQAVTAAEQVRQYSAKSGNGHTKLILQYVEQWQGNGQLKRLPRICPFLQSLDAHWKHKVKLGCRQGVERMYETQKMFR